MGFPGSDIAAGVLAKSVDWIEVAWPLLVPIAGVALFGVALVMLRGVMRD